MRIWFAAGAQAAACGAIAALGLAGGVLGPLYLVGTYLLDRRVQTSPNRHVTGATLVGWVMGLLVPCFLGTMTWGLVVPAFAVCGIAALVILPRYLWHRWVRQRSWTPLNLFVASSAVAYLWLFINDKLAYPIAGEGMALIDTTFLVSSVRYLGSSGFCALLIGVSITAAWERSRRTLALACGVFAALALLSAGAQIAAPSAKQAVSVGVLQVNVGEEYYSMRVESQEARALFEQRLARLLGEIDDVQLLVTPESFDGRFHLAVPQLIEPWQQYARAHQRSVLLSTYIPEASGRKSNAVAGIRPSGAIVGVQNKVYLAPFGETTLEAGQERRVLRLGHGIVAGVLVCIESVSSEPVRTLVAKGANLLVTSTSDISFRTSLVPFLHLSTTRLRALEAGRSMVWASNGGPSGAIDRFGRFHNTAPFRAATTTSFDIALHDDTPPLGRSEPVLLVLALLGALHAARRKTVSVQPVYQGVEASYSVSFALLGVSALLIFGQPAIIELQHGKAERWRLSLEDFYGARPRPLQATDPWEQFRYEGSHHDASAIGYWLAHYGWYATPQSIALASTPGDARKKSDAEMQAWLCEQFGMEMHVVAVRDRNPLLPALVQLRTQEWAVLSNYPSTPAPLLYVPSTGAASYVESAALGELLLSKQGLLPRGRCRTPTPP